MYGPSMEDFMDAHLLLQSVGAGITVRSAAELAERFHELVSNPTELEARGRAGREALLGHRGATQKNREIMERLLRK